MAPLEEEAQALGVDLPPHRGLGQRPLDLVVVRPRPVVRSDELARVVVDADPVDRLADVVEVVLPAVGQVRAEPRQHLVGIPLAEDPRDEEAVVVGVVAVGRVARCRRCRRQARRIRSCRRRRGSTCRARASPGSTRPCASRTWCIARAVARMSRTPGACWPEEMGQPRDAPRLVDRRRGPDAVADPPHDDLGEVGEPARRCRGCASRRRSASGEGSSQW